MKNTTTKKTFILGLFDKDTKQQVFSTTEAYKVIEKMVCKFFWWGSISESRWVYTHDNWKIVIEPSISIISFTEKDHKEFVELLKDIFNQESILVDIQKSELSFE